MIGQRLAAGTVAALTPTRIVSPAQAVVAFGRGSLLADMIAGLKAVNDSTECWAIALDDNGAGVAATKTVTLTGAATATGVLALMIAGTAVPVAVASGASVSTVATAIVAAIAAQPDLPVTASAAAGVVTLTARNKGTAGNDVDVRLNYYQGEATPAGLTVAFAAGTAGAANPDISAVWAAIGDAHYASFILPFGDTATLTSVETELASRAGPLRMIGGIAYVGLAGTQSALAAIGAARNSQYLCPIGAKSSPTPPWRWAAAHGAQIAFYGAIDPARPFQTLPLPGLVAPAEADRFTRVERELLLRDGISTWTVDAGGTVTIERPITTYQLNAQGLDSVAWLDVNTPLTLFYLRHSLRVRFAERWPRHKLASDTATIAAGQAVVRPRDIRAELLALARDWEDAGLVENIDQFAADLQVQRSAGDPNRVDVLVPPDIVNQLRTIAARVEFRL